MSLNARDKPTSPMNRATFSASMDLEKLICLYLRYENHKARLQHQYRMKRYICASLTVAVKRGSQERGAEMT